MAIRHYLDDALRSASVEPEGGSESERKLAETLAALASPSRLALLGAIRQPKTLREVEVPAQPTPDFPNTRTMSRQGVRQHLEKLVEAGFVTTREVERKDRETLEYIVNHQRIFALAEDLRELARRRPTAEPAVDTRTAASPASAFAIRGPCLVLVKGIDEGRTFSLAPPAAGRKEWVIGRRRDVPIPLDFDPFVSSENAAIVWEEGTHSLVDLPESRNGTFLNFQPLPKGGRRPLQTGNLVGVGRSILVFLA